MSGAIPPFPHILLLYTTNNFTFISIEEEVSFTGVLKPQINSEQRISTCISHACKLLMLSTSLLYLPSSAAFQHVSPPAQILLCGSEPHIQLILTSSIIVLNEKVQCVVTDSTAGVQFLAGRGIFLLTTMFRLAMECIPSWSISGVK